MNVRKPIPATDKDYLIKEQYAGMSNYQYRRNASLTDWHTIQYTGEYHLNHFSDILEVGCGDGAFWKSVVNQYKPESHIVLTDISEKMLDDCKKNLSTINFTTNYQVADIDALPYGKETFSAVLAHKVIYHAENPENAIKSIHGILKPNGIFGMSVLNYGVNGAVWKLANSINPDIPDQSFTSRFSNIEADAVLPKIFQDVEKREYISTLKIDKSETVINAVKTSPNVQPLKLPDSFFALFKEKVEEQIADKGCVESEFNASLYLCRK